MVGVYCAGPLFQTLQQCGDAPQVDDAEGSLVRQRRHQAVSRAAHLLFVVGGGGCLAEFRDAGSRLAGCRLDHGRPVPARAGFQLLRCTEVAGVGLKHLGDFQRGHQAGVEANVVQGDPRDGLGALQRRRHGVHSHHRLAVRKVFVTTKAEVAAAVVPQHQHGAVCRVGAHAPCHKVLQRAA